MAFRTVQVEQALAHLRSADPVLEDVIDRVGPFTLRAKRDRFAMLVRSILSQQISTKAAESIRNRLLTRLKPEPLKPGSLANLTDEDLRAVGLSGQKVRYLRDLIDHVQSGQIELATIGRRDDTEIIAALTQVKGIGEWTAQMFLIFSLGRMDVLPHADLGIRTALKNLYALDDLPNRADAERLAMPWRPYATIASWYCWRSLELTSPADSTE
ncbi:DNA-3-methyladenine glycosylase family protein [Thalassoroseus pseudoceratinae]|uniref:DNA-3-methyladenine glycosylase family protein n=1 Tax=Thalassoroseus pseudoceratinae TaxID=2713176 RepID=UPI001422CDCA|nr:DNA-3-methyladenine glycosylase [Thalassoroseus pseudoceratinae]